MDYTNIIIGIMCGFNAVLLLFMLFIWRELQRVAKAHAERIRTQAGVTLDHAHRLVKVEQFIRSRTPCKTCGKHCYTEPENLR